MLRARLGAYTSGNRRDSGEIQVRKTIPVIRAAALVPLLKWLAARGRPVEDMLRAAGMGYVWVENPYAPVPIRALEHLVIQAARLEGPDVGCRIIGERSLHDIAALGEIALGSRSPRDGIARVCMALPYHCSHEIISMTAGARETVIHEYWNLTIDPEALHIFQQFVAGLVQAVVQRAVAGEPALRRVSIVPHPVHGLDHLRPWFSGEICAAPRSRLDVSIRNAVLDTPFRHVARNRIEHLERIPWQRLRDGTLSGSARYLIRAMLQDGAPTIERMSVAAGMRFTSMPVDLHLHAGIVPRRPRDLLGLEQLAVDPAAGHHHEAPGRQDWSFGTISSACSRRNRRRPSSRISRNLRQGPLRRAFLCPDARSRNSPATPHVSEARPPGRVGVHEPAAGLGLSGTLREARVAFAGARSRASFLNFLTTMSRFSLEMWSMNSTPFRWSISCCRQVASRPSASISCCLPSRSR